LTHFSLRNAITQQLSFLARQLADLSGRQGQSEQ